MDTTAQPSESHLASESQPAPDSLWSELQETRARTLRLVEGLSTEHLQRILTPLLSPLVWDMGHIANFEQRWLLGDESRLDGVYNPFENPRETRGDLPLLAPEDCLAYMAAVREQTATALPGCDPFTVELVIEHEQQHNETMLQLLRMIDGYVPAWREAPATDARASNDLGYWVELPAGEYEIGTTPSGPSEFAYDNECNAHRVALATVQIARRPVTNAEYVAWVQDGGYARDEWWTPEGRAWRDEQGANAPLAWQRDGEGGWLERNGGICEPLRPDAPVIHVSWFEADAFARAHGARLPSEQEWEAAATHDPATGERHRNTWGEGPWRRGDAVFDQRSFGTVPLGATAAMPVTPLGCQQMLGQVWEWTASDFAAYPGFEPFRYREYSAPFFDGRYKVLRGGSWATRPRTVSARFRNWDFPQRRQIFAGIRLARD